MGLLLKVCLTPILELLKNAANLVQTSHRTKPMGQHGCMNPAIPTIRQT